jgi:DNA-directed RNA polymerase specialized sigma54-like protein
LYYSFLEGKNMASIIMEKSEQNVKDNGEVVDWVKRFAEMDWENLARQYSCDTTHFRHGVAVALENNPGFAESIKKKKAEHKKVVDIWATMTRRPHGC